MAADWHNPVNCTTLKYRLYPTKAQKTVLEQTLFICCEVYNSFVNWRKYDYEVNKTAPTCHVQAVALAGWKVYHPELLLVHSQVLQNVAMRVDLAYKSFFRRARAGGTTGYPRLKGHGQYDSFTYPQVGFKVGERFVTLSKLGQLKTKLHRPVTGKLKTCTIRRQAGKWFVCFCVEQEPAFLPMSAEAIGIDVGLSKFATLSNGEVVENPRYFRNDKQELARASRRVAKTKKSNSTRRRASKVLSRIHERIRNRRHNFVHQTARRIVNRYGLIAIEKLNVKGMVKNHCLAKSISDASWSMFRTIPTAKAESAGREFHEVDPRYTSQTCSACGNIAKKKLNERVHCCCICGLCMDRDANAAVNILCGATQRERHSVQEAFGLEPRELSQ